MNKHTFLHPTTKAKIAYAMRKAVQLSKERGGVGSVYIANKKGDVFLRVTYYKQGLKSGFRFDSGNTDLNRHVLAALRTK